LIARPARKRTRYFAFAAVGLALLALSYPLWLPKIGQVLANGGPPSKADYVLVLAGGSNGARILAGAELARRGFAPLVLVSGPDGSYGHFESELAIDFAVNHGYPRGMFMAVDHTGRSTVEEAAIMLEDLRRRNAQRCLVVTSDFHTARAGRIYHRMAAGIDIRIVAATEPDFDIHHWWRTREGRKIIFFEWTKSIADWLRM
jgi:uncharacterized SAM-binding protein YcdF (DUF218 family)